MGIQGLSRVIGDHAPQALYNTEIGAYVGRKIAIDASTSIYQFLIAVRAQNGLNFSNEAGETTSHLMGMFYRTVRMVEHGIKPVYVFDGKPPQLKQGELAKRSDRRQEAQKSLEAAREAGDMTLVDRYTRRTVRVTKEHGEDCRKLLKLMGIPYLEAPCEAEAQCAALAKAGKVWAVASEDMDTLCFGSPRLLRHLTFSEMKKVSIEEFHLEKVLKGLELSHEEFIDLCIMLGCDYTETIKGVGPKTAVNLIKQHRRIEDIIPNLPPKKVAPEDWNYDAVRKLFLEPEVMDPKDIVLKWSTPDEDGIVKFLCDENGFSRNNIKNAVAKLKKGMSSVTQGRLDGFFKAKPADAKAPVAANGGGKAKKTTASGTKRKSASGSATTTGSSTKKSKTKTKPK